MPHKFSRLLESDCLHTHRGTEKEELQRRKQRGCKRQEGESEFPGVHRTLPTHSQAQVHFSQNKPTGYFKEGFQPFEEFKRTLKAFLLSRCLNSSLSHHLEMKCSPPGRFTLCVTSWFLLGRRPSGDLSLSVITSLFKKVHIHVQSGSKICEHCGEKPRPFLHWERHQHFPKESSVRTLISWPPLS